jgi:hypothetical protein
MNALGLSHQIQTCRTASNSASMPHPRPQASPAHSLPHNNHHALAAGGAAQEKTGEDVPSDAAVSIAAMAPAVLRCQGNRTETGSNECAGLFGWRGFSRFPLAGVARRCFFSLMGTSWQPLSGETGMQCAGCSVPIGPTGQRTHGSLIMLHVCQGLGRDNWQACSTHVTVQELWPSTGPAGMSMYMNVMPTACHSTEH